MSETDTERVAVMVELRGDFRPEHILRERSVIGRSPDNAVWINDPLVSRRHAEIVQRDDGTYEIVDLGSTHGTFVNREKVERWVLDEGDEIFVGATQLLFERRDAADISTRRHRTRLVCRIPVELTTVEGATTPTVATDVSLGGLRVDWSSPIEGGERVALRLHPEGAAPVAVHALVSHWADEQGIGLNFDYESEEEYEAVAAAYAAVYLANGD